MIVIMTMTTRKTFDSTLTYDEEPVALKDYFSFSCYREWSAQCSLSNSPVRTERVEKNHKIWVFFFYISSRLNFLNLYWSSVLKYTVVFTFRHHINQFGDIYIYMLHKKTVLVKKRHFYVKKLLFYKLSGCKNTAFLQKYIFVKSSFFTQVTWL